MTGLAKAMRPSRTQVLSGEPGGSRRRAMVSGKSAGASVMPSVKWIGQLAFRKLDEWRGADCCGRCGALVVDARAHAYWHRENDR